MSTDTREIELLLGQSSSCSVTGELDEQGEAETPVASPTEVLPPQEEGEETVEVGDAEEMADNCVDHGGDDRRQEKTDNGGAEEGSNKVDARADNCVGNAAKKKKKAHGGKRKKAKKARVTWTGELHQLFLGAIEKLGIDKAAPRKILELMKRPELTRAHVASHLQKFRQYLRRKLEGKEPGLGRSTRFHMSRRKSVFDTTPFMSIVNIKNQMDMAPRAPADPGSYTMMTPQSTSHRLISSPLLKPSTAYMGFSLTPQQPQPQLQNPRGLGLQNTLLFDSRPRTTTSSFFGFGSQLGAGGFSSLPSYGLHYDPGRVNKTLASFNTTPVAGNCAQAAAGSANLLDLLGNANNNTNNSNLLGLQSRKLANYVGLQLETATRQLGFGQNGSICASDVFLQDDLNVTPEPNETMDYDFLDQVIKGNHLPAAAPGKEKVGSSDHLQKSTGVQRDSPQQIDLSISLVQNDSSITSTNGSSNGAAITVDQVTSPPQNSVKEQQNELSVNDFTGIGFNLEDDIAFGNFTSLLFDQEHDDGTLAAENTNNFTAMTEGDDQKEED